MESRTPRARAAFLFLLFLALAIPFGLYLRLAHLGGYSLWFDELWSVSAATEPLLNRFLHRWLMSDVHPPVWNVLLRGWVELFGDSEVAVRSPSVIFGALFVAHVSLAPRWPTTHQRVMLAALASTCLGGVFFSQEARCYALLALAGSALFEHWQRGWSRRTALLAIATSWIHLYGLIFASSILLFEAVRTLRVRQWRVLAGIFATGLIASTWLLLIWVAGLRPALNHFWIDYLPPWQAAWDAARLFVPLAARWRLHVGGWPVWFTASSIAVSLAIAVNAMRTWRTSNADQQIERRRKVALRAFYCVVMVLGISALLSIVRPIQGDRYFMVLAAPMLSLLVAACAELGSRDRPWPPIAVAFALVTLNSFLTLDEMNERWRARDNFRDADRLLARQCRGKYYGYFWHETPSKTIRYQLDSMVNHYYVEAQGNVACAPLRMTTPADLNARPDDLDALLFVGLPTQASASADAAIAFLNQHGYRRINFETARPGATVVMMRGSLDVQ